MRDFHELKVWEKAHQLTLKVYTCTRAFPQSEIYGLISQMRRAAISIPANIAEGGARGSDADFARFLQIAAGSASELEYYLILARDLAFLSVTDHAGLPEELIEIKKMLTAFVRQLRADS
jgi:four helix bundle protein